jgi:uncharacterized damage-inducible protein DinB
MPKTVRRMLKSPRGYRSKEAALLVAALDDLTRTLFDEDLKGVTTAELAWQLAPGHNTIGMLLAHLAIVEVHWTQIGVERLEKSDVSRIIEIGNDDDGIPVPAGGAPPVTLEKKPLKWYREQLELARTYVVRRWRPLTTRDLGRTITRHRRDGTRVVLDPRWVLYHIVEHFAAHQGQINLIRHQYRDSGKKKT